MKAYILYYNNGKEDILQRAFIDKEEAFSICSKWNAEKVENGYYKIVQCEV